jgi:SAM-dependent methyltransferase
VNDQREANRRRWDERVAHHLVSDFYDLDGFRKGRTSLLGIELEELGEVEGKRILHLQCHFGMDSLSLARRGAEVTGVDFSGEAILQARMLSEEIGTPARFMEANIYDLDEVLQERFDIVFTSYGVLCWLDDIGRWAEIVASHLEPGGFLYIVENHPFGVLIDGSVEDHFHPGLPYFSDGNFSYEDEGTYIDPELVLENRMSYEWHHTLGDIISSLASNGLRIEFLHEFPFGFFPIHPSMRKGEDGYWYLPEGFNVPLIFSLKATRNHEGF